MPPTYIVYILIYSTYILYIQYILENGKMSMAEIFKNSTATQTITSVHLLKSERLANKGSYGYNSSKEDTIKGSI